MPDEVHPKPVSPKDPKKLQNNGMLQKLVDRKMLNFFFFFPF